MVVSVIVDKITMFNKLRNHEHQAQRALYDEDFDLYYYNKIEYKKTLEELEEQYDDTN